MKHWVLKALGLLGGVLLAAQAQAQDFPSRHVTLVNPYAPGGPADLLGRTIAESVSETLGQRIIVENRPGAATAIGAAYVARAKPDGYTLFIGGSPSHVITPALNRESGYDGVKDFQPIATVANLPNVLVVGPHVPAKDLKELVALAKAKPDEMSYASVGEGSLPHLSGILLEQSAGLELIHVPYGGAAPAVVDILGKHVDMGFLNLSSVISYIKDGRLRALAVAKPDRAVQLPDVPTLQELGYPDFDMSTWYGISAPAGTPKPVVDRLHAAIRDALQAPAVREKLLSQGAEILLKSPEEFTTFLKADADRMLKLIEVAGLRKN